jgi:phosphoglucomutase
MAHPRAGQPALPEDLVDLPHLVTAYYSLQPDPDDMAQQVAFGTSGHRGSALNGAFNEAHILAITQAIVEYRGAHGTTGPLFIGRDTHGLSEPAWVSALEVLAANDVVAMIDSADRYTPTPAVSHAILTYNRGRTEALADGIVVTPSHNPPYDGGFKYNPPNGGPADTDVTGWIQKRANALLESGLREVRRVPFAQALRASSTHEHDFIDAYVSDLGNVIDFDAVRGSGVHLGVDPLGGAGVHYWAPIAERYKIDLTVVSEKVDLTFGFMTVDWDGKIRMDPSSSYAMQRLIHLRDRYDVAFACDTDHDRHGVVTRSSGLLLPNHYLSVLVDYLYQHRPEWRPDAAVGKTLVSTALIDRVAKRLGRKLYEVPVGFKWFVDGLFDGSLGFGGEESAGASFLRRDSGVWSTDKDGIAAALMSAEITARTGRDPGELYRQLTDELGRPLSERVDAPANVEQKARLSKLSPEQVKSTELAGDKIVSVLDRAPANGASIGGIKVVSESGWFAARPSGTEDIYKIYAESFKDEAHLQQLLQEAQSIVDAALSAA